MATTEALQINFALSAMIVCAGMKISQILAAL